MTGQDKDSGLVLPRGYAKKEEPQEKKIKIRSREFEWAGIPFKATVVDRPALHDASTHQQVGGLALELNTVLNMATLIGTAVVKDLQDAGHDPKHFKQLAKNTDLRLVTADNRVISVASLLENP